MTDEKKPKLTVINNRDLDNPIRPKPEESYQSNPLGKTANPYYEKLMQFTTDQKRKRFTVEDLLKW